MSTFGRMWQIERWRDVCGCCVSLLQLRDELTAAEAALLLQTLSRSPCCCSSEQFAAVLAAVVPRLQVLADSFTSLQLSQVLSAASRAPAVLPPFFFEFAARRLRLLLAAGEFQQPFELAMVLSAAAKLKQLATPELLQQLSAHVQRLLRRCRFPVRDLAVLLQGFAAAGHADPLLFASAADAAMKGLAEATAVDTGRLLQAFAAAAAQQTSALAKPAAAAAGAAALTPAVVAADPSSNSNSSSSSSSEGPASVFVAAHRRVFKECVKALGDRVLFAAAAELTAAAQAAGLALLQSQGEEAQALMALLQHIRSAAVGSLGLFTAPALAALLHTFARWRLEFPPRDLLKVIRRLTQLSNAAAPAAAAAAAAAAATADPAAAATDVPWHPVFSPAAAAAALDNTTRLSCLHSLGVLLRPFAAAATAAAAAAAAGATAPARGNSCSAEAAPGGAACGGQRHPSVAAAAAAATAAAGREGSTQFVRLPAAAAAAAAAAPEAAEALAAGDALFGEWMDFVLISYAAQINKEKEINNSRGQQQQQQQQQQQKNIQPLLRLAETLANCTFFSSSRRFAAPLQQLLLQQHAAVDAAAAAKLLQHFKALGFAEEDDVLLLLHEKAQALQPDAPAAAAATAAAAAAAAAYGGAGCEDTTEFPPTADKLLLLYPPAAGGSRT
ncbi:hypothetical protein, conserved [Eimeria necatrix]|uniref:Uncharacterized protein n=1 Tax=Eimeria necatrix TaxID=51315 RepID=U6MJ87_9EIME|nr:hypothetical protein, conserved [Eimeria necatrix]CDJ63133.1 hypothetical protein, conserved [Eimeria necatrix]